MNKYEEWNKLESGDIVNLGELVDILSLLTLPWKKGRQEDSQSRIATLIPLMHRAGIISYQSDGNTNSCEFHPVDYTEKGKGMRHATRFGVYLNERIIHHPLTKDFSEHLLLVQKEPITDSDAPFRHSWDFTLALKELNYAIRFDEANTDNHQQDNGNDLFKPNIEILEGENIYINRYIQGKDSFKEYFEEKLLPYIIGAIAIFKPSHNLSLEKKNELNCFCKDFILNYLWFNVKEIHQMKLKKIRSLPESQTRQSLLQKTNSIDMSIMKGLIYSTGENKSISFKTPISLNMIGELLTQKNQLDNPAVQSNNQEILRNLVSIILLKNQFEKDETDWYLSINGTLSLLLSKPVCNKFSDESVNELRNYILDINTPNIELERLSVKLMMKYSNKSYID